MTEVYDGMTTAQFLQTQAANRRGKRHQNSRKVVIDNIEFDSQVEAGRYQELKLLERAGNIQQLEARKSHLGLVIVNRCKRWGQTVRKRVYTPDFRYWDVEAGHYVIEEVKGYRISKKTGKRLPVVNESFRLRFDLARAAYPEYDFRIVLR